MNVRTFRFTVDGDYTFPLDMLRYDGCWPASSEDAVAMERKGPRTVTLISHFNPPTEARWRSFGWHVVAGHDWSTDMANSPKRRTA